MSKNSARSVASPPHGCRVGALSMMVCFGLYLAGTDFVASSIDGWITGLGSFIRHYIGAADRFDSFAKGVIDNRDALYFLVGIAGCLVLNGFWIEGRMRPKARLQ